MDAEILLSEKETGRNFGFRPEILTVKRFTARQDYLRTLTAIATPEIATTMRTAKPIRPASPVVGPVLLVAAGLEADSAGADAEEVPPVVEDVAAEDVLVVEDVAVEDVSVVEDVAAEESVEDVSVEDSVAEVSVEVSAEVSAEASSEEVSAAEESSAELSSDGVSAEVSPPETGSPSRTWTSSMKANVAASSTVT